MSIIKPWLLIDVDDVCYDFVKALYEVSKKNNLLRDPDLHYKDWETYNHLDYINFDDQEKFREFLTKGNVLSTPFQREGAKEFLKWAQEHFNICFITARGYHPEAKEVTEEFFQSILDFKPDRIIISGLYGDSKKSHIGSFIGSPILGFIDDSISHVRDFTDLGIDSYLVAQNWNKDNNGLKRISSFDEIKESLTMKNKDLIFHRPRVK